MSHTKFVTLTLLTAGLVLAVVGEAPAQPVGNPPPNMAPDRNPRPLFINPRPNGPTFGQPPGNMAADRIIPAWQVIPPPGNPPPNWGGDRVAPPLYVNPPSGGPTTDEGFRPDQIAPLPVPPPARMLGVYTQPIYLTNGRIALQVTAAVPGTPAARVGLEPGDIIVIANRYLMQSHENLRWAVANSGPGMNLTIINVRNGQYQSMYVPL
jgi:hypothetical protein